MWIEMGSLSEGPEFDGFIIAAGYKDRLWGVLWMKANVINIWEMVALWDWG